MLKYSLFAMLWILIFGADRSMAFFLVNDLSGEAKND